MRGTLDKFYAGIHVMIPAPRARQPREEEMKCGTQSADIRMVHRRSHLSRVALPIRCHALPLASLQPFVLARERLLPSLDITGHIKTYRSPKGQTCAAESAQPQAAAKTRRWLRKISD